MNVWGTVAAERRALVHHLWAVDGSVWAKPSRCGDWTVHDVLAHLVYLAEGTIPKVFLANAKAHPLSPNKAIGKVARQLASEASPTELLTRLRAASEGRFTLPGFPPVVALGEVLVHRADITDATGIPPHAPDEAMRTVLDAERRLWFAFGVPRKVRALHLKPTDADWTVGPAGGALVEGPAQQLLLATVGRGGATAGLTGPGVSVLS